MQERSAIVVGALVVLLVLFPLGFLVHVAPRFPGSLAGSLIGISAAILMLVPLIYVAGKRIPVVHRYFAPRIESRTLLSVHIYAGVLAPILGLIHAAHKFDSPMGISLTGIMLVLVISGYVGRYMLIQIGRGLRGRAQELAQLRAALAGAGMAHLMSETSDAPRNIVQRLLLTSAYPGTRGALDSEATIASALADVEYAVRSENVVNSLFGRWRKVHIVLATILYFLLVLHIWSGVYYGFEVDMKPVVLLYTIFAAAALIVGVAVPLTMHHSGSNAIPGWEGLVSPGPVSKAHQFIASQCETCHKPFSGVVSNNCVTCHSLASFADKQSTRFHVAATQCTSCHVEHGERPHMTVMDHSALTRADFWSDTVAQLRSAGLVGASPIPGSAAAIPTDHRLDRDAVLHLNCASCHSNVDPHRARFGPDCASCHSTNTWLIAAFEHPADQISTDCNACHKAPPSHYMMHFKMISQHVAHQDAPVEHCYACHTTDAWNNIRGYGWYKHH